MDFVVDNVWNLDWTVSYDEAHDRDLFLETVTGSVTDAKAQLDSETENLDNNAYGQDYPIDALSGPATDMTALPEAEIPACEGVIDPETGLELEVVFSETSSIATAARSIHCNTNYPDNYQSYDYSSSNLDYQPSNAVWHNNSYPTYQSSNLLPPNDLSSCDPYQSSAFDTTYPPRPSNRWKLLKATDKRTSYEKPEPRWPPLSRGIFDDSAVLLHHPYDNQNLADRPDDGSTDLSVASEPSNAASTGPFFSSTLLHGANPADQSDGLIVGTDSTRNDSSKSPISSNPSTPSSTPNMLHNCLPLRRRGPVSLSPFNWRSTHKLLNTDSPTTSNL